MQLHHEHVQPIELRPNGLRVRHPCRQLDLGDVQPELFGNGCQLPCRHDGVPVRSQWGMHCVGRMEHQPNWRVHGCGYRRGQLMAWQLEHHTERLLHVHPEHQHIWAQWIRDMERDHPKRVDRISRGDVRFGHHLQRHLRRRLFRPQRLQLRS